MSLWVFLPPTVALGATAAVSYLGTRMTRGSAERLRARQAEEPLAHALPYWAFLDEGGAGLAVGVDGTYTALLELSGIDTDCADGETLNHVNHALHGMLLGLPAGVLLQFIHETTGDVADPVARYRAAARGSHPLGQLLVEEKAALLLGARGLRRSELLLAISLPPKVRSGPAPAAGLGARLGLPLREFPQVSQSQHTERLGHLATVTDQVARGLAGAGVASRTLSARSIRLLAYRLLNPRRARLVPDPWAEHPAAGRARAFSDAQSAREQLVFAGLNEGADRVRLDGQLLRVLTLKALPTWTEPALLEALLVSLPFHARVQVTVEALEGLRALDELKRRRDQAHLLATLRERRNQEAEAQEHDAEELIEKNLRSSVRMVRLGLTVILSVPADAPFADRTLEAETQEVIRLVSGLHGAQLMVDEHAQEDELLAALPGNAHRGRRLRRATSENAAHLLLAWQAWTGNRAPAVLLENGRGQLVGLDPFDDGLDNPNAFMAGASGSGKSATTNYLLLHLLASGAKAVIIDVGGSYGRLIELFDGRNFSIALDGDERHGLNPFFPPSDIVRPDGRLDERRLVFVLAVLERMVSDARRPELGNAERAVLTAAVLATYRRAGARTPILSDLTRSLRDPEALAGLAGRVDPADVAIAEGLARDLRVWTEGPAARLVNRPSTVSLTTELAAFDLKGLESNPQLQAVVMLILSGIVWNLVMQDRAARKIVVFDEVWRLLESPASARLVAELYRTSRKYRASILTISQAVEDFTASPIAAALTNNSATVYLLRHRRGHELVAGQFHLNARELEVFKGLEMRRGEYTEMLVLHGEHHFLARVVLSPLEYWIATTHPADLALEARLAAARPELSRLARLRLLATRAPRGAQGGNDLDTDMDTDLDTDSAAGAA
jgi:conjugal transfer ATP-binding protein TraC